MPCDEPARQSFHCCFSMEGFGTVVSGEEGPELGPRIGERDAEDGNEGCDFGGFVEFVELKGH